MRWLLPLAALTACGGSREPGSFSLRVALTGPLLPLSGRDTEASSSSVAQNWVFEPLGALDEKGAIVPRLARTIERIDARRLRVRLRPATFSDGTALTDEEVVRSLENNHLRAVPADGALVVEAIDGVSPVDLLLARTPIFRSAPSGDVGTGPFVVRAQGPDRIVLKRRIQKPRSIDEVILLGFATARDTFVRTLRGDADLVRLTQPRDLEFFEGVPRLRIVRGPGTAVHAAAFNLKRLSRDDRVALVDALRPETISNLAYGAGCVPVSSRASGAPMPAGRPLDILVPVGSDERLALAIRRSLGTRGGNVRAFDLKHYFRALKAGEFDLAIARPLIAPPESAVLIWRTGAPVNLLDYSNPGVDAALDAADWEGARRELEKDPPAAFFCTQDRLAVADARLDARLGTYDLLESLPEWEVVR